MAELERISPSSAATRYRSLKQVFNWLDDEGETDASPMAKMRHPRSRRSLPVLGFGKDFRNRRERAIIRLFLDTGMRLDGISGLRYSADDPEFSDVDLTSRVARITSRGGHELVLPIGPKTCRERYIRARAAHPRAAEPWLWLGKKGRLTASGIYQMIKDRSSGPVLWPDLAHYQGFSAGPFTLRLGHPAGVAARSATSDLDQVPTRTDPGG